MAALKDFRRAGVVVFCNVRSKKDKKLMPLATKKLHSTVGKTFPYAYGLSSDGEVVITGFPYTKLKNGGTRKAARVFKADFAKYVEETSPKEEASSEEEETPRSHLLAEPQEWINVKGKSIHAGVMSVDAEYVVFQVKNKPVKYPLSKLSAESQAKLKALQK